MGSFVVYLIFRFLPSSSIEIGVYIVVPSPYTYFALGLFPQMFVTATFSFCGSDAFVCRLTHTLSHSSCCVWRVIANLVCYLLPFEPTRSNEFLHVFVCFFCSFSIGDCTGHLVYNSFLGCSRYSLLAQTHHDGNSCGGIIYFCFCAVYRPYF